jgi:polar amino acid transport system substrate-binding protein
VSHTHVLRRVSCRALGVAGALAVAAGLTACGADGGSDSAGSVVPSADVGALRNEVPKAFDDGISVATQTDIAPFTYTDDDGDTVGFDQDMLGALSDVLGVKISVHPVTFENLVLGLDSGKYHFVADTTITRERLAKYDMLSYMTASYSVATAAKAAELGSEETVLCGKKIGVVTGEVIVTYVKDTIDPACAEAGAEAVAMTEYKDFASMVLATRSGNVQGMLADTVTYSQYQKNNKVDLVLNGPAQLNQSDAGYSFRKDSANAELAPVMQKAVDKLIANGTYAKLLKKYALTSVEVAGGKSVLNPPVKG